MRILIIRPEPSATLTAQKVEQLGHLPILFPMSKCVCISAIDYTQQAEASGYIFTSANALRCFNPPISTRERIFQKPSFVVGPRTQDAARDKGFKTIFNANGNSRKLAELIVEKVKNNEISVDSDAPLLYFTTRERTPILEKMLSDRKIDIKALEIYETISNFSIEKFEDIGKNANIDLVLFYSANAVRRFFAAMSSADIKLFTSCRYGCLSKEVASQIPPEFSHRVDIAIEPNEHHLLAVIGH